MPHLAPWQWLLGIFCAFMIGVAKTGAPGVGTMVAPLMVLMVGDARMATAWALPVLSHGGRFCRRVLAQARRGPAALLADSVGGGGDRGRRAALSLDERIIRRVIGVIIVGMVVLYLWRRFSPTPQVAGKPAFYGVCTGFATTVANAAGPVMSLYLLSKKLPKEKFVATGAWFFFAMNLLKAPIYAWYDLYSRASLTFACCGAGGLAGALAGQWLVRNMTQKVFELAVITLTAVSCLFLFR